MKLVGLRLDTILTVNLAGLGAISPMSTSLGNANITTDDSFIGKSFKYIFSGMLQNPNGQNFVLQPAPVLGFGTITTTAIGNGTYPIYLEVDFHPVASTPNTYIYFGKFLGADQVWQDLKGSTNLTLPLTIQPNMFLNTSPAGSLFIPDKLEIIVTD